VVSGACSRHLQSGGIVGFAPRPQEGPAGDKLRARYEAIMGDKRNCRRSQFRISWAEGEYRQYLDHMGLKCCTPPPSSLLRRRNYTNQNQNIKYKDSGKMWGRGNQGQYRNCMTVILYFVDLFVSLWTPSSRPIPMSPGPVPEQTPRKRRRCRRRRSSATGCRASTGRSAGSQTRARVEGWQGGSRHLDCSKGVKCKGVASASLVQLVR
jgi:hypothetical protein